MDYRTIKPILEFSQGDKSVFCVSQTQNLALKKKKKERKAKYLTKEHSTEKGGFYFTKLVVVRPSWPILIPKHVEELKSQLLRTPLVMHR